jgi:hypothetical protein
MSTIRTFSEPPIRQIPCQMWFIAYRHPRRPDEAGIKFVQSEAEAVAEGRQLEARSYIIEKIALTSKARVDAYLAGESDP